MQTSKQKLILVTGATGYLASNLIKLLLEKNYKVRGTVRSLSKKKHLPIYNLVPSKKKNLSFVEANLNNPEQWNEATKGVDWIAHLASPFFLGSPKDPQKELILPATNGVKNVFNSALKNGIKRIVMTSSIAAVAYGDNSYKKNYFNENDWSENAPRYYDLSKYLAEKEAWKICDENKGKISLTTICPGVIIGKHLLKRHCASMDTIKEFFNMPALPRFKFGFVDVKDVALAHLLAFEKDISIGKRYIINCETVKAEKVSDNFRNEFGKFGYWFAKFHISKCFYIAFKFFDKENLKLVRYWGNDIEFDNKKSKEELGIVYRSWEKAMNEMVYQMIDRGMLRNRIGNNKKND